MVNKNSMFPPNFLWGASTSAHQVEGGNHNQWTVWELANAKSLARSAHTRLEWLSNWNDIKQEAQDPANYISGRAVDHYHKYKEDFKIASKLNFNAFRFGIEWARIEPVNGRWNTQEIQHYKSYIKELRKNGLEPILNIWHWTNPVWFEKKGAFTKRKNLIYFERFVQKIASEFGSELTYIITINEPNVYMSNSYGMGWWPPQEKNWFKALGVYFNLLSAHKKAYRILKNTNKHLMVGIAPQLASIQPKREKNIIDKISVKVMEYFWNWWFLNRIHKFQDFVGLNYYFSDYYRNTKMDNPETPKSDLGWYLEPEGLHPLLKKIWSRYRKPIIITESGVADSNDKYRKWWVEQSIIAMERSISEGVQVIGYLHWSMLDNFEWAYGWWPKFGLVSVDSKTLKRLVRPSAMWFSQKIKDLRS